MVASSACRSELTRAYKATRRWSSMTLSAPCFLGPKGGGVVAGMAGRGCRPPGPLPDHRPDLLVGHGQELLLEPMSLEALSHAPFGRFAAPVLHDRFPRNTLK